MLRLIRNFRVKQKSKQTLQQRYPQHIVGRHSYGQPVIHAWGEGATLEIGAFCSFASGVQIFLGGEHRVDWVSTFPFNVLWPTGKGIQGHPKTKGNVKIGHDVWIGTEAIVMSGVTIGDGAVIAARAIVTKDVPPYAIVAGNPARIVRNRFDDEIITRLLAIQWWHWDDATIAKKLPEMLDTQVAKFANEHCPANMRS